MSYLSYLNLFEFEFVLSYGDFAEWVGFNVFMTGPLRFRLGTYGVKNGEQQKNYFT